MSDGAMDSGSDDRRYDPGPSFVENDRPSVRLAELPAWLQTFASSVGDPAEDEPGSQPEPEAASVVEQPDVEQGATETSSLPDWLQDDEPAPAPAAPPEPQESAPSFMITEDDLPEWLRSIPGEATAEPAARPDPSNSEQEAPSTNGVLEVPPISHAWITAAAQRGLGDGGSVFALVASQIEPVAAGYTAARGLDTAQTHTGAAEGGDYSKLRSDGEAASPVKTADSEPGSGSRRLRIALLVLLLLVIVVLILVGQLQ